MINIGDEKGAFLLSAVEQRSPKYALELGTFAGYSSILIANALITPGARLISIDVSPNNANIATQMIHYAGVDANNKTTVWVGTATTHLRSIMKTMLVDTFDFVFLDHDKGAYLSDLLYLMNNKLLSKGAVVVADNMIHPGAPDYLNYVQSNTETLKTILFSAHLEYSTDTLDAVAVTTVF
jgi:catechol O-methyltransferase